MSRLTIRQAVQGMLKLAETGEHATMLGIGPMSSSLIQAVFELAKTEGFPPMFIASRNQVDRDEMGAGYVNGWDQRRFAADIKRIADEVGYAGPYYLCRDHGGPWQRDEERNGHLPEDQAMELARASFVADMEAGFDLLMVDPTKDPHQIGKVIPLDIVLRRTIDLIDYLEGYRRERGLPEVAYEVGTEETNGGLTSTAKYEEFIAALKPELGCRGCPMPTFIVGQTGTLTRLTEQVGHYDFKAARELADMARRYGVGLKEHNADYLDDATLLAHIPAHVTASNVAPQYGTEETRAYLKLCETERLLVDNGLCADPSNLYDVLLVKAIKTERWRKWMTGDDVDLRVKDILANKKLSLEVLDISGHYVFNDPDVGAEIERLYANLAVAGIDGKRFVIEHIKRPIKQYVVGLNLTGVTERIERVLGL